MIGGLGEKGSWYFSILFILQYNLFALRLQYNEQGQQGRDK